ncbi:hypothetical protein PISMIDRAFT_18593 [Pisolithus microcarpus 441]|uniref:Uncharacterized protein n=1 Tax=Pisolithus microcarpus 441 TaxID=765257 RepID=A0A0C9YXJ8_9AGAM|nr:hypothetical protein BKA83DRAFT_18593 [Pisolithus microcarpus]KIK12658.1 hypothetical protein PISMIDRAFT_18593 [Pisolithus microcarpus 441]
MHSLAIGFYSTSNSPLTVLASPDDPSLPSNQRHFSVSTPGGVSQKLEEEEQSSGCAAGLQSSRGCDMPSEVLAPSVISSPDNLVEAHLLLEMAISNCNIHHIQQSLAEQLVRCDMLQLQYNHLQVEKARSRLATAELHVGWVHMVVRHCGYNPDIGVPTTSS